MPVAFQRASQLGLGIETDIRDQDCRLVVSHDMASAESTAMHALHDAVKAGVTLALNIKSDGLANLLQTEMAPYKQSDWFAFDMSIPDMRQHLKVGNPVFARMSEVEQEPPWLEGCQGVWLDQFDRQWFDATLVTNLLDSGKRVCVVSPELHGRPHIGLWHMIQPIKTHAGLSICTDFPEMAKTFFDGESDD